MESRRRRRDRDPGEYISGNLTVAAWDALNDVQAKTRTADTNPSKSAVLIAMRAVAETHMDEILDRLRETA
jgi:hypothetical protein